MQGMTTLASLYAEHYGDRVAAAVAYVRALYGGAGVGQSDSTVLEAAIVTAWRDFALNEIEVIRLVSAVWATSFGSYSTKA